MKLFQAVFSAELIACLNITYYITYNITISSHSCRMAISLTNTKAIMDGCGWIDEYKGITFRSCQYSSIKRNSLYRKEMDDRNNRHSNLFVSLLM